MLSHSDRRVRTGGRVSRLVFEMAGPAVGPAQHNREYSEGDDKRCHKEHFSCRHDLLLLLPLSAAMVAKPAPIALIRINLPSPWYWNSWSQGQSCWLDPGQPDPVNVRSN